MNIHADSMTATLAGLDLPGLARKIGLAAILALGSLYSGVVEAVTDDPNDYVALAPGTNLLVQYAEFSKENGLNLDGIGHLPARLDQEVGLIRAVHFASLFGFTINPTVLIPFGSINNVQIDGAPQNSSSGLGDPIFESTFWAVNLPATATYFGVTPILTLPLGEYRRADSVNFGSNRVQGDIQLGFQTEFGTSGLAKQIVLALYGDGNFYGANTHSAIRSGNVLSQATLRQETSWQLQPWLSFTTQTGGTTVSLGYSASMGGRQTLAGAPTGMRIQEQQIRSELQTFVTKHIQLAGEVTHDLRVNGGFRQDFGFTARVLFIL